MWGDPKIVPQNRLSSAPPEPPSFQWWRWRWTNRRFNPLNVLISSQRDGQKREKGLLYIVVREDARVRIDLYTTLLFSRHHWSIPPSPATFYSTHGNAVPHSSFPPFWKRKKKSIDRRVEQSRTRGEKHQTPQAQEERKKEKKENSLRVQDGRSTDHWSLCLSVCLCNIYFPILLLFELLSSFFPIAYVDWTNQPFLFSLALYFPSFFRFRPDRYIHTLFLSPSSLFHLCRLHKVRPWVSFLNENLKKKSILPGAILINLKRSDIFF